MEQPEQLSPEIVRLEWGRITIQDNGILKDVKLYPGGAREWDWNETGTQHVPGIQPADCEELIRYGSEVIVLSSGFYERLGTSKETLLLLDEKKISYHILQSEAAVKKYNELRKTGAVGALIHSTC